MTREHIGAVSLLRLEWLNDHTEKKWLTRTSRQERVLFAEEWGCGSSTHGIQNFLDQELKLSHSSDNAGSLTARALGHQGTPRVLSILSGTGAMLSTLLLFFPL